MRKLLPKSQPHNTQDDGGLIDVQLMCQELMASCQLVLSVHRECCGVQSACAASATPVHQLLDQALALALAYLTWSYQDAEAVLQFTEYSQQFVRAFQQPASVSAGVAAVFVAMRQGNYHKAIRIATSSTTPIPVRAVLNRLVACYTHAPSFSAILP